MMYFQRREISIELEIIFNTRMKGQKEISYWRGSNMFLNFMHYHHRYFKNVIYFPQTYVNYFMFYKGMHIFCSQGGNRIGNEKPHSTHRIHSSGPLRWPRASDCDFSLFNYHIYIKCRGKFGHHHSHPGGLPSTHPYVFFPQELVCVRNFLHNCLHS